MSIISLTEAKEYVRVDTTTDDNLMSLQIGAIDEYIKNATGKTVEWLTTNKIAKLFGLMLIEYLYENRKLIVSLDEKMSILATGFILQLKYNYVGEGDVTE